MKLETERLLIRSFKFSDDNDLYENATSIYILKEETINKVK